MDRWGRSFPNCFASIEELAFLGVRWSALSEGIDTDKGGATGGLLRTLMRACREFGREMRREEIRAGMRVAKRGRDTTCGRPKVVFDRSKVAELRQAGESIRGIANKLGVGVGTVHRLLSVPKG
jgi:DNA invertase Pin-like site-specific DNA recombinase